MIGNFNNFDKINESAGRTQQAVVYQWGKYDRTVQWADAKELQEMIRLTPDMLEGMDLRDEDRECTFYAWDLDIDDTNVEEEGYGIKRAYGVKLDAEQERLVKAIMQGAGSYCMDNEDDKQNLISWMYDNMDIDAAEVLGKNTSWCTDNEDDVRDMVIVITNL
jgi:hypothetical protein